jgi:hypothetical protein
MVSWLTVAADTFFGRTLPGWISAGAAAAVVEAAVAARSAQAAMMPRRCGLV